MSEPMITVCRGDERFVTRTEWLTEYSSFSFGRHYDPRNTGFGRLLVHNEDVVAPGYGFDAHTHADTEIVTWMLSGALIHSDSAGNQGIIHPGLVQRTTAGAGIQHCERNDGYRTPDGYRVDPDGVREPAHYIQMWIQPDEYGLEPSYAQAEVDQRCLGSGWLPVISGIDHDATITINASATLWATTAAAGESRPLPPGPGDQHVFVTGGLWDVETVGEVHRSDALRIRGAEQLGFTARTDAQALVWQLPAVR